MNTSTENPFFPSTASSSTDKIQERDLVLPALLMLANLEQMGLDKVSTTQMRKLLERAVVLSDQDKKVTEHDDVNRFGRTVRNLISHNTLSKLGLTKTYKETMNDPNTYFKLTMAGRAHLLDSFLGMLPQPSFEDLKTREPVLQVDPNLVSKGLERKLQTTALLTLAQLQSQSGAGYVPTSLWRRATKQMEKTFAPEDVQLVPNSNEMRVDKVIRGFILNGTFTKPRWIRIHEDGLKLTDRGKARLLQSFLHVLPRPELEGLHGKVKQEVKAPTLEKKKVPKI